MDTLYDEDITQNPFFVELQTVHSELFNQCISEGWVLCVPRVTTVISQTFTVQDFLGHILISNEELPTTHFMTLTDKTITVQNRIITLDQERNGLPAEIHILFDETFYTSDKVKYKVWCIEFPLELENHVKSHNVISHCKILHTLADCIDYIWTESSGKEVLETMDLEINKCKIELSKLQSNSLHHYKELIGNLFANCLHITLKNQSLKERCKNCKNAMANLKLSVETYILHGVYKELFQGLTVCTAFEDSYLNKTIRNLSDIQLHDLHVNQQFTNHIPVAKRNLSMIQSYSSVLGKVSCIKSTIVIFNKTSNLDFFVSMDDMLSILIFLVLKSGIPNWLAHLNFLKHFRFSSNQNCSHSDEISFCISTLEAVLEQIKLGLILSLPQQESLSSQSDASYEIIGSSNGNIQGCSNNLECLFEQVKLNNLETVKNILEQSKASRMSFDEINANVLLNFNNLSLEDVLSEDESSSDVMCHPLCDCRKCCHLISNNLYKSAPTVSSRDDHGFTILHVAVLFNRIRLIDLILEMNGDVEAVDYSGSTPLHCAASKGHQTAMLLLLHVGADYNKQNMDKNTPLHLATNNGHDSCVKAMIYFCEQSQNALDLQPINKNGDTPLHLASKWGYQAIVRVLLDSGADPSVKNHKGKTPVDCSHNPLITQLLLSNIYEYVNVTFDSSKKTSELKSDVVLVDLNEHNTIHQNGNSVNLSTSEVVKPRSMRDIHNTERLFRAITFGDVKLACFYMKIDYESGNKSTTSFDTTVCHPLCVCIKCLEVKSSFDQENFNINMCDSKGDTALHIAVKHNRTEICKLLLNNGAVADARNNIGQTPLHIAAKENKIEIIKELFKHSKCIKCKDSIGNTPLHLACKAGSIEAVKLLLAAEPYDGVKNLAHRTPLDEAKDELHLTIIQLLEESENNKSNN